MGRWSTFVIVSVATFGTCVLRIEDLEQNMKAAWVAANEATTGTLSTALEVWSKQSSTAQYLEYMLPNYWLIAGVGLLAVSIAVGAAHGVLGRYRRPRHAVSAGVAVPAALIGVLVFGVYLLRFFAGIK